MTMSVAISIGAVRLEEIAALGGPLAAVDDLGALL
jgi:hypothetical protein